MDFLDQLSNKVLLKKQMVAVICCRGLTAFLD